MSMNGPPSRLPPRAGVVWPAASSASLASCLTSRLLRLVALAQSSPAQQPSLAALDTADPATAQYLARIQAQQLDAQRKLDTDTSHFAAELVSGIPVDLAAQIPQLQAAAAAIPQLEDAAKAVQELRAELGSLRDEVARERKAFADTLAAERVERATERAALDSRLRVLEGRTPTLAPEPDTQLLEDVKQLRSVVGLSRKRPRDEGQDEADQIRDADTVPAEADLPGGLLDVLPGVQKGVRGVIERVSLLEVHSTMDNDKIAKFESRIDAIKSTVDALVTRPVAPVIPETYPQHPNQLHRVLSDTTTSVSTLVTQLGDLGAAQRHLQGVLTQLEDLAPLRADTNKTMEACQTLADKLRPLVLLVPVLETRLAKLDADGEDRAIVDAWLSNALPYLKREVEALVAARTGQPPGPGVQQVLGPAVRPTPPDK